MKKLLLTLFAALIVSVLVFVSPSKAVAGECHTGDCSEFSLYIEHTDIVDNASAKFPVAVDMDYTFHIRVNNPALKGKKITFSSPNPWLSLVNGGSISDGGSANKNTNFTITWPQGNDGDVTFVAKVLPSNVKMWSSANGMMNMRGSLMTIGAHIIGAKCNPKLELYGVTNAD